jgi:hypothetical protein
MALGLAACGGSAPSAPSSGDEAVVIRATTSFGFCIGYCQTRLEITSEGMSFVEEAASGELPPVVRQASLSAEEWNALVAAVDRGRIEALPGTVGCPDCADGGAESLEVVATDWSHAVKFDYGATMPELQPLLGLVRSLRDRFDQTRPAG